MVGDTRQLHHDHTHVLHTLGYLDIQQLLYCHMPPHIVDRRRAIVQPIRQGRDLIKWSMLSNLLKRPVNITYRRYTTDDALSIDLAHILEYTVRGRVSRSYIERDQLILRIIVIKDRVIVRYFTYGFAHLLVVYRPK